MNPHLCYAERRYIFFMLAISAIVASSFLPPQPITQFNEKYVELVPEIVFLIPASARDFFELDTAVLSFALIHRS